MKIHYEAVCIVLGLGLFLGLLGLIDTFSLTAFLMQGGIGAFIGFAALPYFDSKKYKPQPFLCAVIASSIVIALAISREQSGASIALSGMAGFIFGYLSPSLAKYF